MSSFNYWSLAKALRGPPRVPTIFRKPQQEELISSLARLIPASVVGRASKEAPRATNKNHLGSLVNATIEMRMHEFSASFQGKNANEQNNGEKLALACACGSFIITRPSPKFIGPPAVMNERIMSETASPPICSSPRSWSVSKYSFPPLRQVENPELLKKPKERSDIIRDPRGRLGAMSVEILLGALVAPKDSNEIFLCFRSAPERTCRTIREPMLNYTIK